MKLTLYKANAERFELNLAARGDEPKVVSLSQLDEVTVEFAQEGPGTSQLRSVHARGAVLESIDWQLPDNRRVHAANGGQLFGLDLDLALAPSVTGHARADRLAAAAVTVELGTEPGARRVTLDVVADQLSLARTPERAGHVASERLEVGDLQVVLSAVLLRLRRAVLDTVRLDLHGDAPLLVGTNRAELDGLSLSGRGVTAELDTASLPEGLRTSGRSLVIPELVIPELRVTIDDVMALGSPGDGKPATDGLDAGTDRGRGTEAKSTRFDFLDRVSGQFDVDLVLELSLPLLGRRAATHHLRVPIANGVINYRELEDDLANLESAFIGLEVRGTSLVLLRTIPIIPGLDKPLVFWDLDPEELEFAKSRLVHLRVLPHLRMAAKSSDRSDKSSSVAVKRVRFEEIRLGLSIAESSDPQRDALAGLAAATLELSGRLDHVVGQSTQPTELHFEASDISAGPAAFGSDRSVGFEHATVDAVTLATLIMNGLKPSSARFVLEGIRLRNLRLSLAGDTGDAGDATGVPAFDGSAEAGVDTGDIADAATDVAPSVDKAAD